MSRPRIKLQGNGMGHSERTKIFMPDGQEIPGIQSAKVEIRAGGMAQLVVTFVDFEIDLDTERDRG